MYHYGGFEHAGYVDILLSGEVNFLSTSLRSVVVIRRSV